MRRRELGRRGDRRQTGRHEVRLRRRSSAGPTPASPRCSIAWSARSSPSSRTSRRPRATASSASRHLPGAAQIVFVDTPGIHKPLHRLNVRMVDAALDALREADVVVAVVDAQRAAGRRRSLPARHRRKRRSAARPGLNKIDLRPEAGAAAAASRLRPQDRLRRHRAGLGADGRRTSIASNRCCSRICRKASRSIPRTT